MANETGDKAACYHLARQYENQVSISPYNLNDFKMVSIRKAVTSVQSCGHCVYTHFFLARVYALCELGLRVHFGSASSKICVELLPT